MTWQEFKTWQKQPYEVAPMSEERHRCSTCGTEYQGNYCPRCGQSARIGRYSLTKAVVLLLDVWGLGNRGMFRTLRDLILRPGYMIRDYLSGMQMAYFPPFKLFFLLTTLSLLVEGGMNISGVNYLDVSREQFKTGFTDSFKENPTDVPPETRAINAKTEQFGVYLMGFTQKFPSISTLALLLVLSGFLYIFFRRSPYIPDLRFSELLVALVYITDMLSVYNIVLEFFSVNPLIVYASTLLALIPLRQLSGFSLLKCIFFLLLSFLMLMLCFILAGIVIAVMSL